MSRGHGTSRAHWSVDATAPSLVRAVHLVLDDLAPALPASAPRNVPGPTPQRPPRRSRSGAVTAALSAAASAAGVGSAQRTCGLGRTRRASSMSLTTGMLPAASISSATSVMLVNDIARPAMRPPVEIVELGRASAGRGNVNGTSSPRGGGAVDVDLLVGMEPVEEHERNAGELVAAPREVRAAVEDDARRGAGGSGSRYTAESQPNGTTSLDEPGRVTHHPVEHLSERDAAERKPVGHRGQLVLGAVPVEVRLVVLDEVQPTRRPRPYWTMRWADSHADATTASTSSIPVADVTHLGAHAPASVAGCERVSSVASTPCLS